MFALGYVICYFSGMFGLEVKLSQTEIRKRSISIKGALVEELIALKGGEDFSNQHFNKLYALNGYDIGVSKPGKEVFSDSIKYQSGIKSNNPNDMTPKLFLNGDVVKYDGSFEAIFKEFVRIHESEHALKIIGGLLYRNAFVLDHKLVDGSWRYSPPMEAIIEVERSCSRFLGLPVIVFLNYLELIACNEDTKYHTLGYDINKGFGRRNNLLTYAHVIHVILQKHYLSEEDFLLAFMSFAGRLTSPPAGLNPISNKKAMESFSYLTPPKL